MREKHKIVQIVVFPIIFDTDCSPILDVYLQGRLVNLQNQKEKAENVHNKEPSIKGSAKTPKEASGHFWNMLHNLKKFNSCNSLPDEKQLKKWPAVEINVFYHQTVLNIL